MFSFAITALAQPHTSDVELSLQGGAITTGRFGIGPERVFVSEMGRSFANFTSNPGFDCQLGTFPVPSRNGFRVLDALREWNGSDFLQLSEEALEISFSTLLVTTPPAPAVVEGFTLAVGSNGTWHRHLEFTLVDGAGGPAPIAGGIYLLQIQIFSNNAGVAASQPFWIMFDNQADPASLDAAVLWARRNLVGGGTGPTCDYDFNADENVDLIDAQLMAQVAAGIITPEPGWLDGDLNRDENADLTDAQLLAQYVASGVCPF
jgi:hypothetical protein